MKKLTATIILTFILSCLHTITAATQDTTKVWFDDAIPAGAIGTGPKGSQLKWISQNPHPFSGAKALQTNVENGLHEYSFNWAGDKFVIEDGDKILVHVYIDPQNPPKQIMLSFRSNTWEHRAYWGENRINYGTDGTQSRHPAGALPASGSWQLLEIPASDIGLAGKTVSGMSFSLYGGRATFDCISKAPITQPTEEIVWFNDKLPAGAKGSGWDWFSSNPSPYSGAKAHRSKITHGLHEYSFNWATEKLAFEKDDVIFAYVYLDPANMPAEVMLSWKTSSWEHRAYWGKNLISYGSNGTASRRYMGPLPASGKWVRIEVPASQLGLENKTANGMSFSLYGGRAFLDSVGKESKTKSTPLPPPRHPSRHLLQSPRQSPPPRQRLNSI